MADDGQAQGSAPRELQQQGPGVPRPVVWDFAPAPKGTNSLRARSREFSPGSTLAPEESDVDESPHAAAELCLHCGTCQIPHPQKASYGGEDSLFFCPKSSAVGVADGVSEWGWRFGINPRDFANELMDGARTAVDVAWGPASERAAKAMADGFASVRSFGASTAVVAVLDAAASELGVANLGDSGVRQFRHDTRGWQLVARTQEQHHSLSQPFQLSRIPAPADFPRLLFEGKKALVDAARKCKNVKQDSPRNAELYSFSVQEGDVFILGSDGVFDNLYDAELGDILEEINPSPEGLALQDAAATVAHAAESRSQDPTAASPFGDRAKQAGFTYAGGTLDDITVVVACVAWAGGGCTHEGA